MPHLKCISCKTRCYTADSGADASDHLCPCCGCAFEPAGGPCELVGFRVITPLDGSAARGARGTDQGFVDRLGDVLDRRVRQGQARPDDKRSTDLDRTAVAEAVALPRPETTC